MKETTVMEDGGELLVEVASNSVRVPEEEKIKHQINYYSCYFGQGSRKGVGVERGVETRPSLWKDCAY